MENKLRYNAPFIFGQNRAKAILEVIRDYHVNDAVKENEDAEKIVKCWNEYDKLKEERDLLIEVLKIFIDNTGYLDIWCNDSGWDKINKAKELLNTIKK